MCMHLPRTLHPSPPPPLQPVQLLWVCSTWLQRGQPRLPDSRHRRRWKRKWRYLNPTCTYLTIRGGYGVSNLSATVVHSPTDIHNIPWGKVKSVSWPSLETHFLDTTRCALDRQLYFCFRMHAWTISEPDLPQNENIPKSHAKSPTAQDVFWPTPGSPASIYETVFKQELLCVYLLVWTTKAVSMHWGSTMCSTTYIRLCCVLGMRVEDIMIVFFPRS